MYKITPAQAIKNVSPQKIPLSSFLSYQLTLNPQVSAILTFSIIKIFFLFLKNRNISGIIHTKLFHIWLLFLNISRACSFAWLNDIPL